MTDPLIWSEVLRTTLWGVAVTAPLKYYLLKNHVDKPTQNAVIMTAWGLIVGHFLFADSCRRLNSSNTL